MIKYQLDKFSATTDYCMHAIPAVMCTSYLSGHTSIGGTLPFSGSCVTALPPCDSIPSHPPSRVNYNRLPDDQTIFNQFPDVLSCKIIR